MDTWLQGDYGVISCKLDYLSSQHICGSLANVRDSCGVANTFKNLYLFIEDGCECSLLWDPSDDRVNTAVWVGSIGWLHHFWHGEDEIKVK